MPPDPSSEILTAPSLKALLADIIDYAGLFPPAGLPLEEALPNYARYRHEAEAWMLARFVIPLQHLGNLDAFADLLAGGPAFRFSVLGTGGDTANAFLQAFDRDLNTLANFHRQHRGQVRTEAMEVRLPPPLLDAEPETLGAFLAALGRRAARLAGLHLFFEVPLDARIARIAPPLLDALAVYNQAHETPAGLKMRTGGLESEAFPSAEHLATAILACHDAEVPFKATAGLHHPLRAYHAGVQTKMYGFFNVFGGAVLAATHALDVTSLTTILLEEDAGSFRFGDETFAWNDLSATLGQIEHARTRLAISFGSCSFDEPREDLRALGLL